MAKKVEIERVKRFFRDRNVLEHYNDGEIAQRMGLTKSSFSSYINGRYPITNVFLKKFYIAFEVELKTIGEKPTVYSKPDEITEEQRKRINELERKADKLIESHELIIMDIRRLEQRLNDMLEVAFEKMEALVSRKSGAAKKAAKKTAKKTIKRKPGKVSSTKGSPGEEESPK